MTASFDLISQPWIPCVRRDGTTAEFGLRDVLVQAHALRELGGESPLVTAALHRLLLAILHRVFGPDGYDAWYALAGGTLRHPAALDGTLRSGVSGSTCFTRRGPSTRPQIGVLRLHPSSL